MQKILGNSPKESQMHSDKCNMLIQLLGKMGEIPKILLNNLFFLSDTTTTLTTCLFKTSANWILNRKNDWKLFQKLNY